MSIPYNSPYKVNITISSILKVVAIALVLYLCYIIKDVLALLFVSLIFSAAIDPWVDKMQRFKIPRAITVLFIYLMATVIITAVVILIIPPITEQVGTLVERFPDYVDKVSSGYYVVKDFTIQHGYLDKIKSAVGGLEDNINRAVEGVFSTVSGLFGGVISFFIVLVITFYMVVEEDALKKIVWSLAPPDKQTYIMQLINRMQRQVGYWLRGQLILMFLVGFFTWIGLLFIMPEYALVLGLIAGLTEFIPYLGPILGAVPAIFLALTINPFLALLVAILYLIIQQVEGNILVPKIMQRAVGLNPIVSIAVLMAGLKIAGIVGGLLSIPVATALSVMVKDWVRMRNSKEKIGEE
ncbi:MAG: AI-2E family transporter [Patescibacteria group bacterium]